MNLRPYNEIIDSSKNVRSSYNGIYQLWQTFSEEKKDILRKESKKIISDDYQIDPLPRILTTSEFSFLQIAVEQRAKAILSFLCDYSKKDSNWSKVIPPSLLKMIMLRHHYDDALLLQDTKTIAFPYGPDIIRDKNGEWKVIEDSAGMLGGFGDLLVAPKILSSWHNDSKKILTRSNNPKLFYKELAAHFKRLALEKDGVPVLYLRSYNLEVDHETYRLAKIFKKLGFEICINGSKKSELIVEKNGLFLKKDKNIYRIGYLMTYAGPESDPVYRFNSIFANFDQASLKLIFKHTKRHFSKSWRDSLIQGHARTNFSPGVWFINDKAFGIFVDDIIRLYLKEEPLIKSIPAFLFILNKNEQWVLDKKLYTNVLDNKNNFVIKHANKDGGSGVFIGKKLSLERWVKICNIVKSKPEEYIVQQYEALSLIEDRIVDIRIHAHVDSDKIIVSNTPWGRANWKNSDGKVNISSKGFLSPVLVINNNQNSLIH